MGNPSYETQLTLAAALYNAHVATAIDQDVDSPFYKPLVSDYKFAHTEGHAFEIVPFEQIPQREKERFVDWALAAILQTFEH